MMTTGQDNTEQGHTPTPWIDYDNVHGAHIVRADDTHGGLCIASMDVANAPSAAEQDANAAFIVLAVNAHDALVAALEPLAALATVFDPPSRPSQGTLDDGIVYEFMWHDGSHVLTVGMLRAARAAIAKARGQ